MCQTVYISPPLVFQVPAQLQATCLAVRSATVPVTRPAVSVMLTAMDGETVAMIACQPVLRVRMHCAKFSELTRVYLHKILTSVFLYPSLSFV